MQHIAISDCCKMADYPFSGTIDQLLALFTASQYDQAIAEVYARVNYNDRYYLDPTGILETWRLEWIRNIINAYVNVLNDNSKLPNYNPTYKDLDSQQELIKNVVVASGQNTELVIKTLDQLYYGTMDGSIKSVSVLYPRKLQQKETPDNTDSWQNTFSFNQGYLKYLPYGILGIAALTGLFFATKITSNIKEVIE